MLESMLLFGDMNWISKQIVGFFVGLVDDLHTYLSNQGMMIESFFESFGEGGENILAFNLDTGNIYGVFGAKIYVACIGIMTLLVGLLYMYQLMKTSVSPNPNKIAEIKGNISGLAIGILLVGFAPYIVDALVQLRTIILEFALNWLGLSTNGDAVYSLYKSGASKSVLGMLLLVVYVGCSFYLSFVYLTLALMQMFYFAFFPIIAMRGMVDRKVLVEWVRTFLLWMVIPLVDVVLLALPITVISQNSNIFLGGTLLLAFLSIRGFVYAKLGVDLGPSDAVAHKAFGTAAGSVKAIGSTIGSGVKSVAGGVSGAISNGREAHKHKELDELEKESSSSSGGDNTKNPPPDDAPTQGGASSPESSDSKNKNGGATENDGVTEESNGGVSGEGGTDNGEDNGTAITNLDESSDAVNGGAVSVNEVPDADAVDDAENKENGETIDDVTSKASGDDKAEMEETGVENPDAEKLNNGPTVNEGVAGSSGDAPGKSDTSKTDEEMAQKAKRDEILRKYINVKNFDSAENKKLLSDKELRSMYTKRAIKSVGAGVGGALRSAAELQGSIVGGAFGAMVGGESSTAPIGKNAGGVVGNSLAFVAENLPYTAMGQGAVKAVKATGQAVNFAGTTIRDGASELRAAPHVAIMNAAVHAGNSTGASQSPYVCNDSYIDNYLGAFPGADIANGYEGAADRFQFDFSKADRQTGQDVTWGRELLGGAVFEGGQTISGIDAIRSVANVSGIYEHNTGMIGASNVSQRGLGRIEPVELGRSMRMDVASKNQVRDLIKSCFNNNIYFDETGNMCARPFSDKQMERFSGIISDIFGGNSDRMQNVDNSVAKHNGKLVFDASGAGGNRWKSQKVAKVLDDPPTEAQVMQAKALEALKNNTPEE